jgi:dipeptidyl aminopeptidase/acylaminoacyl peptidase
MLSMRTAIAGLLALLAVTVRGADLDERPVEIPAYQSIPRIGWYASPEEFEAALRDTRFRLTRVSYESGGLTVFAYVYAPAKAPKAKLPVIVFNRGSYVWKEFAGEYLTMFHRLASAGFLVVAPMYRGSGGAPGRDEMGGADLDDLLNTVSLIRRLPAADPEAVFMYGESRGGMMTYQAIRERYPMRAAAVIGGFTDLRPLADPGGRFATIAKEIFPDYAERRDEIARRRSAVDFAARLDTPVLIMHGGADGAVEPFHALTLAAKLQELGKSYQLIIRAGEDHHLSHWQAGRDAAAVEWFRQHMKKEP